MSDRVQRYIGDTIYSMGLGWLSHKAGAPAGLAILIGCGAWVVLMRLAFILEDVRR